MLKRKTRVNGKDLRQPFQIGERRKLLRIKGQQFNSPAENLRLRFRKKLQAGKTLKILRIKNRGSIPLQKNILPNQILGKLYKAGKLL